MVRNVNLPSGDAPKRPISSHWHSNFPDEPGIVLAPVASGGSDSPPDNKPRSSSWEMMTAEYCSCAKDM
jgi:hypothetical protein